MNVDGEQYGQIWRIEWESNAEGVGKRRLMVNRSFCGADCDIYIAMCIVTLVRRTNGHLGEWEGKLCGQVAYHSNSMWGLSLFAQFSDEVVSFPLNSSQVCWCLCMYIICVEYMFVFHLNNSKIDDDSICDSIAGTTASRTTIEASPYMSKCFFSVYRHYEGGEKHKEWELAKRLYIRMNRNRIGQAAQSILLKIINFTS